MNRETALADLRFDISCITRVGAAPSTILLIRAEQALTDTEIEVLVAHASGAAALSALTHTEAMAAIGGY